MLNMSRHVAEQFQSRQAGKQDAVCGTPPHLDPQGTAQRDSFRKESRHNIVVGTIYFTVWGDEQTNVNFYEVVAVSDSGISIRELHQKVVRSTLLSELVVPNLKMYVGPMERKSVGPNGFKVDGHKASIWNGKPLVQTAVGTEY